MSSAGDGVFKGIVYPGWLSGTREWPGRNESHPTLATLPISSLAEDFWVAGAWSRRHLIRQDTHGEMI